MRRSLHALWAAALLTAVSAASMQAAEPLSVPYTIGMTTEDDLATWTLYDVDNNGVEKANWMIANADMGGACASSWTDALTFKPTDNWMTSPGITLEAGKQYVLSFKAYTSYSEPENLDILISTTPEQDAEHTAVKNLVIPCYYDGYYGLDYNVLLPEISETGTYYITFRHWAENAEGMVVFVKDIKVDVLGYGTLVVPVTYYANGGSQPLAGAIVTGTGPVDLSGVTEEDGTVTFTDIPAGTYKVLASKHGFSEQYYATECTVNAGETTTAYAINLSPMDQTAVVKGTVTDNAGNPIPGARLSLTGYDSYYASTDADGAFRIEGIYNKGYSAMDYTLTVEKNNFELFSKTVSVKKSYYDPEVNAGTMALTYKAVAPASINVTASDGVPAVITWERPIDRKECVIDNGEPATTLGFSNSMGTNFLGVVYPDKMKVNTLSWYRRKQENSEAVPDKVRILIIDLDEEGNPNGQILYQADEIESPLDAWTLHTLESEVEAPRGFMMAITAIGHCSIGKDSNEESVAAERQYYGNSVEHPDSYRSFVEAGWSGALMMRATGEIIETGDFQPAVAYNLYRYTDGGEHGTPIAAATDQLTYTDSEWATLPQGTYRYGVEAVYASDNVTSALTESDKFDNRMITGVTVNVTADSDPADAENATVRLDDGNGTVLAASVSEGKVVFENVKKNTYTLSVAKRGFEAEPKSVDLGTESAYVMDVELKQLIVPVANIDILEQEDKALLSWDLFSDISEDFEGDDFPDFTINPAGEMGWSYIDNDQLPTYGFGATTFPGMRSPMAAIVMNYEATEPALGVRTASSGVRSLACFAAAPTEQGEGMILNHSDDYIFSPRLDFHKDFKFSFKAMTYEEVEGRLESIRVGYSSTTPDLDAITWITDYISVPYSMSYKFTDYEFDIPQEARYVVINSYSDDVFMLLIDDVKIGTGIQHSGQEPSAGKFNGYTVYVDGDKVADKTPEEKSHLITGLSEGQHTAAVEKLYNSGASELMEVSFSVTSGISAIEIESSVTIRSNGRSLRILGQYDMATVWTVDGQRVIDGITGNDPVALDQLAAGVYIVTAKAGAHTVTSKITVK